MSDEKSRRFQVFARAGCHGNDPEIKKCWFWMDERDADSADEAVRAVFDGVKARYPDEWAAWTIDDFKARPAD